MLRFKLCHLAELDEKTKRAIRRRMTCPSGESCMKVWLCNPCSDVHLCLVYLNNRLVTWISLNSQKNVSAWTTSRCRKRGYAQMALKKLIDCHRKILKITSNTCFWVYEKQTMGKILKNLGYRAKTGLRYWDTAGCCAW